jgi:hypothetical protein
MLGSFKMDETVITTHVKEFLTPLPKHFLGLKPYNKNNNKKVLELERTFFG